MGSLARCLPLLTVGRSGLRNVGPKVHPLSKRGCQKMPRILARFPMAVLLFVFLSASAKATPNCLRDNQLYKMTGDVVGWSMPIVPGANCIQGLRWSTTQIYSVSIAEKPKVGDIVLVGPGFRYFAKPDFTGTDSFTLFVVGKNRREAG